MRSYYRAILPFYEKEVVGRGDLAFWAGLCRRWRPRSVLEIGCGLGVVTEAVAAHAPTIGLDLSMTMLLRARARLRRAGRRARLVAADVRRLALTCRFDLVIAPGDPLSHWTRARDRQAALRAIARHLTTDGRFVLDGLYRPADGLVHPRERPIGRRGRYLVRENWKRAGPRDVWIASYEYRRAVAGSRPEARAILRARSWNAGQIERVFASGGLVVQEMWGDFQRRPFRPDSERVLIVAGRHGG